MAESLLPNKNPLVFRTRTRYQGGANVETISAGRTLTAQSKHHQIVLIGVPIQNALTMHFRLLHLSQTSKSV